MNNAALQCDMRGCRNLKGKKKTKCMKNTFLPPPQHETAGASLIAGVLPTFCLLGRVENVALNQFQL